MGEIYTDPASGRAYTVDPVTGQSRWIDQIPQQALPPPPEGPTRPVGLPATPGAAPVQGHKPKTASGIVALIVAVVALTISWVPIVNNVAFALALISGVFGLVGLIATRPQGKRRARWTAITALVLTALVIGIVLLTQALFGKLLGDLGKTIESAGPTGLSSPSAGAGKTPGTSGAVADVIAFGATATFKDGSTLTCAEPVPFQRGEFAVGGEQAKVFLKSQCTFTNHSGQVFKPAGTSGRMSANGTEGESVFQEGLSTPDNPVLPGKSVTWWMGYGVESAADVQLTVSLGFLDYTDITFH